MTSLIRDPDDHRARNAVRLHIYRGADGAPYAYTDHPGAPGTPDRIPFGTPLADAKRQLLATADGARAPAILVFDPLGLLPEVAPEPIHPEDLNASNDG